jgi:hypothetical protein
MLGDAWEAFVDDDINEVRVATVEQRSGKVEVNRLFAENNRHRRQLYRSGARSDDQYARAVIEHTWIADLYDDPETILPQLVPFLPEDVAGRMTDQVEALSWHLTQQMDALADIAGDLRGWLGAVRPLLEACEAAMPLFGSRDAEELWHAFYPGYRLVEAQVHKATELVQATNMYVNAKRARP